MRKFHFKLEAVEKVRKSREQDALRELAAAQRVLQAEKEHKMELISSLQESLVRREEFAKESVTRVVYDTENDFISGTKIRIQQADQAIERAQRKVEKAMAYYLSCRQQRRMIEKLREKAYLAYREEVRLHELKQLDDLYVMHAHREEEVA